MRLSLLHEATLNDIQNRTPLLVKKYLSQSDNADQILQWAADCDPTRGLYVEWIIRNYIRGLIELPDSGDLKNLLGIFDKKKATLAKRDINQYSPDQLREVTADLTSQSNRETKQASRAGKVGLPPGAKLIINDGDVQIVQITTIKASTQLCSGTPWCTANKGSAQSYLDDGPLYVVYVDGERFCLISIGRDEAKDVNNEDLDEHYASEFIDMIKSHGEPPLHPYQVIYNKMQQLQSRDPRLEAEFLNSIGKYDNGERKLTPASIATYYATDVIRGRWPEAESLIASELEPSVAYALNVLKRRWEPAESNILNKTRDQKAINTKDVLKVIAEYSYEFFQGKWPALEALLPNTLEVKSFYYGAIEVRELF